MSLRSINVFSLNVGMSHSLAGLPALISSECLDLIFLQEVSLSSSQIENMLPGFKAVVNIDLNNSSSPGTAIVWKDNLPVDQVCSFSSCRIQTARLGSYRLLNVYAPSGTSKRAERAIFFGQKVFHALQLNGNAPTIFGGDFNSLLKPIDVEGGFGFRQKTCPALQDLIEVGQMVDAFRSCYPEKKEYTFFRPGCAPSRLDRFYVSSSDWSRT